MNTLWVAAVVAISLLILAVPRMRSATPIPLAALATLGGCWVGGQIALPATALGGVLIIYLFVFLLGGFALGSLAVALPAWVSSRLAVDPAAKSSFRSAAVRTCFVPVLFTLATGETLGIVRAYLYLLAPSFLEAPPVLH
jgi:hypothetical protein